MSTVRDMIRKKGGEVFSISPHATVLDALQMMADHNSGALIAMDGGEVVGIVSERDCVRKMDLMGRVARATKVSDIMTEKVIYIEASQQLEECMALMLDKSVRHLPVCHNERLVGLVSIGDLVKWKIEEVQAEADGLKTYIATG